LKGYPHWNSVTGIPFHRERNYTSKSKLMKFSQGLPENETQTAKINLVCCLPFNWKDLFQWLQRLTGEA
jgi:hypothetical protein